MRIKSVILWGIIATLILYSAIWMFVSRAIKNEVREYLDKLQTNNVIEKYAGDLDITGFPFSFNIKFIHPRVKFKKFPGDMLFDGVLAIGVSLFSSKIRTHLSGDLHTRMNLNGQDFDLTLSSKDLSFRVSLANSLVYAGIQMAMGSNNRNKQPFTNMLREITMHTEDLSLMNKLSNKTLFYIENYDSRIRMKMSENYLKMGYSGKVSNAEFQEEFNSLSSSIRSIPMIRKTIDRIDINIRNYFDVFSPYKFGKMNHELVISAEMNDRDKQIDIHKIIFNDALHKINLSGQFNLSEKSTAEGEFAGEFSPEWYELMRLYANRLNLHAFFDKAQATSTKSTSIFSVIFSTVMGFIRDAVLGRESRTAYVPKLHEMGQITSSVDLAYERMPKGFDLKINDLRLKANNFSVQLAGDIHDYEGRDIYHLKAKLQNYTYIVDTGAEYINRILGGMGRALFIFNKQLILSSPVRSKIKLFLRSISDDPQDNSDKLNLTAINKDGRKYPSVGRYSSDEFKIVWNNFVFKVLFMQIQENLDAFAKMLKNPLDVPLDISESAGNTVKKLAEEVLGLFGSGK